MSWAEYYIAFHRQCHLISATDSVTDIHVRPGVRAIPCGEFCACRYLAVCQQQGIPDGGCAVIPNKTTIRAGLGHSGLGQYRAPPG